MAGIGFELRKLTQRDDLLGVVQGYGHAALASTGPWLFTIVSLGGIVFFGSLVTSHEALATFRLIIIYNFAFSLVLSGPVVMVVTRLLADMIYHKNVAEAPSLMLGAMGLLYAVQAPLAGYYYLFHVSMSGEERLAALANFFLVAGIWLVSVFLTALKSYHAVTRSFGIGMLLATTGAALMGTYGSVAGMLMGFNAGLACILFTLVARIFAEYPYPVAHPFRLLRKFGEYWEIALAGFLYNLAIWADKWIMWMAPQREVLPNGMVSYPDYDTAMFLAYLSIVPAMAVFVFHVETGFFEHYVRFFRDIQRHATYAKIQKNHGEIIGSLLDSARNLLVLQGSICLVAILLAPRLFELFDWNFVQLGMFRFGLLGALFHVLFLVGTILLSYFDLRRLVVVMHAVFLISNVAFTYLGMRMGFPYYGYGYFLSSLVGCCLVCALAANCLAQLPYQTFVRNNSALR